MQSFTSHGIPFDPKRDYQGVRYSYQAGYQATKALLDKGCRFTAIFATADVMAIGAIRALQDNGPAGAGGRVGHGRGRPAAEQLPGAETGHRPSDRFSAGKAQRGNPAGKHRAQRCPPAMRRYPLRFSPGRASGKFHTDILLKCSIGN